MVGRDVEYIRYSNSMIKEEVYNPGERCEGLFHEWVNTAGTPKALVETEDGEAYYGGFRVF